jgi:hypothetical protein
MVVLLQQTELTELMEEALKSFTMVLAIVLEEVRMAPADSAVKSQGAADQEMVELEELRPLLEQMEQLAN